MLRVSVKRVLSLSDKVVVSIFDMGNSNFLRSRSISSMYFSKESSDINDGTKHGFK